jgi:hypothetical protein
MKQLRCLFPFLLLGAAAAPSPEPEALMDRIESAVVLPAGAAPLSSYGRYYAWEDRSDGVRKVLGVYVVEPQPQRRWVTQNELPAVMDGGCDVVSVMFDLATDRIEWAECNADG